MSIEDQKAIGRLEKGVEVLEQTVTALAKAQNDHSMHVVAKLDEMSRDVRQSISNVHKRVDDKTEELHGQIDEVLKNHNSLRLNVQKLATTISIVVGVAIYIITKVFDVAKEAITSSFHP